MDTKSTMLIVDDIDVNRAMMAASFSEEYSILYAENGEEAIDVIRRHSKDISVILLDIIMPVMDGIEVLKWLKDSIYSFIPAIAVTADESYQLEALENGAADFISKPADERIIQARIKNVLGRFALEKEQSLNQALQKARVETDNLINSIPGGVAIYRVTDHFETLYFSDGVAALSGYTREEYAAYTNEDASRIIYGEDRPRVFAIAIDAIKSGAPIDIAYRICLKNGGLAWVNLNTALIQADEEGLLVHAVYQRSPKMTQLYANLVNESESAIYVSDTTNYELLYINQKGLDLIGKKRQTVTGKKCYEFLFNQTSPCKFCKIHSMHVDQFIDRDFSYPFNDNIYHIRGKLIDWNGIEAHVEYIEDVTQRRKAEKENKELMEQLSSVIEHVPGGMCLYLVDQSGIRPLVHNQAFYKIFGYSDEKVKSLEQEMTYLNVHPEDLAELQSKLNDAIRTSAPLSHTYRVLNDARKEYIWIYLNGMIIDQPDGTKLCYVSYTDVTKERKIQQQLLQAKDEMQLLMKKEEEALNSYRTLVNTVPGGIALYEIDDDGIKTLFFSDGLCELSGHSREERERICRDDAIALTYKDDVPLLQEAIKNSVINHSNLDLTYRINTKSGKLRWVNFRCTYLNSEYGKPSFYAVFTDVDKMKSIEEAEKEQQLRYQVAIKSSGMNVWEYDIQNDILTVVSNSSRIKQNCFTIENYIHSTVENGYVRADSLQTFYSIFERLKNGEKEVSEDIWYKTTDEAGWWCERVIYTTVFDEKGMPVKAFGAGRDVTREKEALKKFDEEMSYRSALQHTIIDSLKINLTQNTITGGESQFHVLTELIDSNNADLYFSKTVDYVLGEKNREKYKATFNRQSLLSCFNRGDYSVSMEFTRVFDTSKVYWIKYNVHLMKNPETKDIYAFVVVSDTTDENVMKSIMETIARTDYDFFVVVEGLSDKAVDYTVNSRKRLFTEDQAFEKQNEMLLRQIVCTEDVERVAEECRISNVLKNIANGKVHKFDFNMRDKNKNGEIRRKQLQFTLVNKDRSVYLMTRIDVTNVYNEQIRYQKELEQALVSAKQANHAKSDFLARMSHDIRTPMNAIIGMTELAGEEDNPPKTVEYLKNIDSSSHFLLGLINDILDLSKIESGKIKLLEEPLPLETFQQNIKTVILPLMEAKHIDFVMNSNCTVTCILTDKLRFTQIYFNLLSNAVKFTPEGGRIEFSCEHIPDRGGKYGMRCRIRDNGIGMSREFQKRLFEPFHQESRDTNFIQQGTGLGLAIVKNLVEAMEGSISVHSAIGKGTEFIVDLYVSTAELDTEKEKTFGGFDIDLSGVRILLVEDNKLNIVVAKRLLERKGCIVEVAANGRQAVQQFSQTPVFFYDAILMDVRMPVMDGIEATKQIRNMAKADAGTIPIIAMTADAFVEDQDKTKKAGMNAHLSKPIDPSLLYHTLYSFMDETKVVKKENMRDDR
ncbi:MAG: response regulator [Lachnospiraceae bacterium]|nr:response regulator [Lachnospiraceae bacterium]